jgi:hypothetical protein
MNDPRAGWKRPASWSWSRSPRYPARGIQREEANSVRRADRGRSERGRCASLGVDGERRNGANRRLRRTCETPGGIERETQRAVFLPQARQALRSQSDVRSSRQSVYRYIPYSRERDATAYATGKLMAKPGKVFAVAPYSTEVLVALVAGDGARPGLDWTCEFSLRLSA